MTILTIYGRQIQGKGVGTKDVVPTINLEVPTNLELPYGVYAARVTLQYPEDRRILPAAVHYGPRPTVQDHTPSLEVHVLDAHGLDADYNAEEIEVEIVQYIRDIKKFDTFTQLRDQIQKDIVGIRGALGYM